MTHRPLSRTDRYLQAKQMAVDMLAELHLYLSTNAPHLCAGSIQEATRMVEGCEQEQQGEVYLLCAQALVQFAAEGLADMLPPCFPVCLEAYLLSLLDSQPSHQPDKTAIKDAYIGKLIKRNQTTQPKRKLFDCLFVDRIDRVLKAVVATSGHTFCKRLRESLAKGLKLASSLLPQGEL